MNFTTPSYAILIVLAFLLVIRTTYVYLWKRKAKRQFADTQMAKKIFKFSSVPQFLFSNLLILIAIIALIIALMDPTTPGENKKVEAFGTDVVYCLDLSNSMNANDIAPSRLDKAKQIIRKSLEKTNTDRVGLVVFARNGYVVIPLTQSYESIDSYLNTIETYNIGNQGTRFEEAIEAASEIFQNSDQTSKNVIFLSDGEDHANDIDKTIEIAQENNLHIITVGIGTTKGSTIPESKNFQDTGLFLDEDDEPVITKLNDESLKKLASSTNGKFIYATSAEETSEQIVLELKNNKDKGTFLLDSYVANHYFQWFAGLALFAIIIVSLTNIRTEFNI